MENWRVMLSTAFNFWTKKMLVNKYKDSENLDPKSLVKNRSVTAEIMLIWTIVARAYMLTEQMLPCQLAYVIEGTRNLTLKFGQNRATYC